MPGKPRDMEEYLAALSPGTRVALAKIRKAIRAAAPGVEDCWSYGLPAFKFRGKTIAALGATAKHCAYYPMSGATIAGLGEELAGYDTSKGAIRFSPDRPLPASLVRKLVKARIAEAGV